MIGVRPPIEPVMESDVGRILAIERKSFPKPWTRLSFLEELSNVNSFNYLIKSNGILAAYTCFHLIAGEMDILKIAVAGQRRREGLASRILRESLKAAKEKNAAAAFLEVSAGNFPAVNFYKKLGFELIGKRRGYYSEIGEDALVMKKKLRTSQPRRIR